MPFTPESLWAFSARASFWAIFEKFSLVPPLHVFRKMRVLGDLAKIAITWSFGKFWCRFFAPKSSPVFALQVQRDNAICASVLLGLSIEVFFLEDF